MGSQCIGPLLFNTINIFAQNIVAKGLLISFIVFAHNSSCNLSGRVGFEIALGWRELNQFLTIIFSDLFRGDQGDIVISAAFLSGNSELAPLRSIVDQKGAEIQGLSSEDRINGKCFYLFSL